MSADRFKIMAVKPEQMKCRETKQQEKTETDREGERGR
jgi:hypothetical protein